MPQLLLEILSEEIPARMQQGAARDLERLAREALTRAGLTFDSLTTYGGPRRLTLVVEGLPPATPDRSEELKGPKTSAPEQALEGFLRKTGLTRADLVERDGVFYATTSTRGRATTEIIAEAVPALMANFPWPKSMRSGSSSFRWVRPLKRVLCLFDGAVVPFEVGGVSAGDLTEGHRFMGSDHAPFAVTDFRDYAIRLFDHFVVLDVAERRRLILEGARAACAAEALELVEDEGLLDEVAGLAEWPVPILGRMDPAFLDLPPEVIRTSMRTHQKYFAVRSSSSAAHSREGGNPDAASTAASGATGSPPSRGRAEERGLAPYFVVIANIEPKDGGAVIAAGNAKVLSARLNDARFFWDQDRAPGSFDKWLKKLRGVTFHAKLGTMAERVERITALATDIAPLVGADPKLTAIAARLCKADLASGMVGEFPELQGVMGGYYAREALAASLSLEGGGIEGGGGATSGGAAHPSTTPTPYPSPLQGEGLTPSQRDQVADAIRDHYKPVGPSDSVPTAPVTVAVALADKLDTLVGFFAIDEKPTGSKDPFALRRAALGMLRIILESGIRTSLPELIVLARLPYLKSNRLGASRLDATFVEIAAFFQERTKVVLRERGFAADVVEAAMAKDKGAHLATLFARVEALSDFLATEDGANLLAGYKRAVNILKKSSLPLEGGGKEGGGGSTSSGAADPSTTPIPDPSPLQGEGGAESDLTLALEAARTEVDAALETEDFTAAMQALAHLRAPVDAFFDKVMVNDPDPDKRLNRLRLLTQVRDTANRVADFSLISG